MLARLMAQRADCLFLDEPTNDLDIPSREALEDVLASYDGALFVVSHDRYLLKRLAERVVAIRDGHATIVDGDYETYEKRQHMLPTAAAETRPNGKPAQSDKRAAHQAKLDAGRRKRAVVDAEKRVADLDAEKAKLEGRFAKSDLYADPTAVITLQLELDRVRMESERAFEEWEKATAELENAER